jgi:hypothetical protein
MTTEQIFTQAVSHRERLTGFLNEYRRFSDELAVPEQRCGQARADEDAAVNDDLADEDEVAERITKAQALQAVHSRRLDHKRAQVSEALKRVENAFPFAEGELRGGCNDELTRRRAIVKARILKAIELPETPVLLRGLADLIEVSALVRSVKDCQPGLNVFSGRSIEAKTVDLLAKFSNLETEKGKAI